MSVREKIIVIGGDYAARVWVYVQDPDTGVWSQLYEHTGAYPGPLTAVAGCSGGQIIAAIHGCPHHFENGVWTQKAAIGGFSPRIFAANNSYNSVWALCYPSNYTTAIWDGSSWGPSRACYSGGGSVNDLWAASATEAWAVGSSMILHTTDGGVSWTDLRAQAESETGLNTSVGSVCGWSANEVYFLGSHGAYGASGMRNKLFRWDGAHFSNVVMDIVRLDHPTTGHNPPLGGQTTFWFDLWPSYFDQGYCERFWGRSSSALALVGRGWAWNGWTWNGGTCEEREFSWDTPDKMETARLIGLSDGSRLVVVPFTGNENMPKESYDGGITWHTVTLGGMSFKDVGVVSFTTIDPSVDEENPIDGASSVSVDSNIHFHLHKGSSNLVESTILVQLNGVDVWKNGVAQPGFSVVKGSIADGFSFDIDPNVNLFPATGYTVYIFAENETDHIHVYWSFSTAANIIVDIFVVAKDIIMATFSEGVVTSNEYLDTSNYEVTNLSGGVTPIVNQILPAYDRISQAMLMKVSQLELGSKYSLLIKRIYNSSGKLSSNMLVTWVQHKTKVDIAVSSFADMWNTNNRSIIRSIIEAVMMSDEKIGGDY